MGKYDDAIGSIEVKVSVKEVLDEASSNEVDRKLKQKQADREQEVKVKVNADNALAELERLNKAALNVKNNLSKAISAGKGFNDVKRHATSLDSIKKQLEALPESVKKGNQVYKETQAIFKDTDKMFKQLTVSQKELNKVQSEGAAKGAEKASKIAVDGAKAQEKALEGVAKAQEKVAKSIALTKKEMAVATERYNKWVSEAGFEHKTIGTELSEGTENWNLRDMVSEAQAIIGHFNDGEMDFSSAYKKSVIGGLGRFIDKYKPYIEYMQTTENHDPYYNLYDNTPALQEQTQLIEQQTAAEKERKAAIEDTTKSLERQGKIYKTTLVPKDNTFVKNEQLRRLNVIKSIDSFEDLVAVVKEYVSLSKQLKPSQTPEYQELERIMNGVSMFEIGGEQGIIAEIQAAYKNLQQAKSAKKNNVSVYRHTEASGNTYEESIYDHDKTIKELTSILNGYIYHAFDGWGHEILEGFGQKRIRDYVQKQIDNFVDIDNVNDKYQLEIEDFNRSIQERIDKIYSLIMPDVYNGQQSNDISNILGNLQYRADRVDRHTLNYETNRLGKILGMSTPYQEIENNAKRIESYEELCDVVARYNELTGGNVIYSGDKGFQTESDELEFKAIQERFKASGIERIWDYANIDGISNNQFEKLTKDLNILSPQAEKNAQEMQQLGEYFEKNNALISQSEGNMAKYHGVLSQVSSGATSAAEAIDVLNKEIAENNALTSGAKKGTLPVNNTFSKEVLANTKIGKQIAIPDSSVTTDPEVANILKGINLNDLTKNISLQKEEREAIHKDLTEYLTTIGKAMKAQASGESPKELWDTSEAQLDNIVNSVLNSGAYKVDNVADNKEFVDFLEYTKTNLVKYTEDYKKEFGDQWKSVINKFGKGTSRVLTKDSSALTINEQWSELVELFPSLFSDDIINEKDQLQRYLDVVGQARDIKKSRKTLDVPLSTQDEDVIYERILEMQNKVQSNVHGILQAEKKVTAEKQKQASLTDPNSQTKVSAEAIIQRNIEKALGQVRSAKDNETTLFNLKGVFDGDDLISQAQGMVENVAKQANLSLQSFSVKDDTIQVKLFNDELQVTVDQMYKLEAATEEADSAILRLTSTKYSQNVKALSGSDFDVDYQKRLANVEVDNLEKQLKGVPYDGLNKLRDAANAIGDSDSLNQFNNELKIAKKEVAAISKQISHQMNTFESMSKTMDGASTHVQHLRHEIESFGNISGVEKLASHVNAMEKALGVYSTTEDSKEKYAAYEQYKKSDAAYRADRVLVQDSKKIIDVEVKNIKAIDDLESKMRNAEIHIENIKTDLDQLGNANGVGKATEAIERMVSATKKFREAKTLADKTVAYNEYSTAKQDYTDFSKYAQIDSKETQRLAELESKMKNVNTELDTMAIKMNKIGSVPGAEKAVDTFYKMEDAAKAFNNAQTLGEKEAAYASYQNYYKQFTAEMNNLNAAQQQQNATQKQSENSIKSYYRTLSNTINQISSLDSKLNTLKTKDGGTGTFLPLIESLEGQKKELLSRVSDISQQMRSALQGSFTQGYKVELPFSSILNNLPDSGDAAAIESFFNDARVQAALTEKDIDNLAFSLQKSQNSLEEFGLGLANKVGDVQKAANTLTKLGSSGAVSTDNDYYQRASNKIMDFLSYKNSLDADITKWSGEETLMFQKLANEAIEYVGVLDKVVQKEAQYFAGKRKYTSGSDDMYNMNALSTEAQSAATGLNNVQDRLAQAVQEFSKGEAIITGFKQSADGIATLDFSVLDRGTNSLRQFSMEMGTVSNNMYVTETSINRSTQKMQAASQQVSKMSSLLKTLELSGFDIMPETAHSSVQRLLSLTQELSAAIQSGKPELIEKIMQKAKIATSDVQKLYNESIKLQNAMGDGTAFKLGNYVESNKLTDYEQLTSAVSQYAANTRGATLEVGKFNEKQGTLNYTMTDGAGNVKHYTASINTLGRSINAQETGVTKLQTGWEHFSATVSHSAKQMLMAFAGYNIFTQAIQTVRQGVTYIKEIDSAMTELKKVTDETATAYEKFVSSAADTGSKIGATVSDYVNATADFARLGYSMKEAGNMAQAAIVYKNVADGLDTVEASTEAITSTMKAFGIESNDTMTIIDSFNEVGNNFAITSAGIGEALKRSASALYEGGNTMEESIGLITGANTVVQDPEVVGELLPSNIVICCEKTAISVKGQRWFRPSKDFTVYYVLLS